MSDTYVIFQNPSRTECGCTSLQQWRTKHFLRKDANGVSMRILGRFKAKNHTAAMRKYHRRMGFEEYKP